MQAKGTLIEQVDKRTRNSKTHYLGGYKYAWDGTIGSIHYQEDGEWKDIDNIFEPAVAPWNWQMLKADYHIRVKEDFTAGQIIEFEKQGETLQFQPMALEWTNDLDQIQPISMPINVKPIINNPEVDLLPAVGMLSHQGTIKWNNGYGLGRHFEWKCTPTRLVKILEIENLSKLPIPEQYILDGGNPILRLNLIFDPSVDVNIYVDGRKWDRKTKIQTFDVIRFEKSGGGVLWGFMPLRYWDSAGNNGQSLATLERRGNKLYVSIRVPYDWLNKAVYPVFIDQTIEVFLSHYRYFHADAWDGDKKWLIAEPDGAAPTSSSSAPLNATGNYLIQGFTTEPLNVDSLSAGDWGFYLWGNHDGTTLVARLFVQVRKNDVNGDLLATTNYTSNLTTTQTEHYCYLSFPQTVWTSGDKVWIGVYVNVTTKQNGKKAYFYYDHNTRLSRVKDPSIDKSVGAGADDGDGYAPDTFSNTGTTVFFDYGTDWQFFRFTGVTIPAGATINIGTYFSIWTWFTTGTVRTKIGADDQLNPSAPTTFAQLSGITWTTAKPDWDNIPDADNWTNSPELQSVIAELVASYDYSAGSAMQIVTKYDTGGGGRTSAYTYNQSPAGTYAPKLHIEYTVAVVPRHGIVSFQDPAIV